MILKIAFSNRKSVLIDGIDDIEFEKYSRDEFPDELTYEGSETSDYIYELTIHKRDGNIIKKNVSSKFFIMNDQGNTVEIISP